MQLIPEKSLVDRMRHYRKAQESNKKRILASEMSEDQIARYSKSRRGLVALAWEQRALIRKQREYKIERNEAREKAYQEHLEKKGIKPREI